MKINVVFTQKTTDNIKYGYKLKIVPKNAQESYYRKETAGKGRWLIQRVLLW